MLFCLFINAADPFLPTDAFFAYILGVISGLQDVLATADQRK